MLNSADLTSLIVVIVGPLSAMGAAREHQAGTISVILFSVWGLVLGVVLAKASSKAAYAALNMKQIPSMACLIIYGVVPILGIVAVALLSFLSVAILLPQK
jgi:hypothetical protein